MVNKVFFSGELAGTETNCLSRCLPTEDPAATRKNFSNPPTNATQAMRHPRPDSTCIVVIKGQFLRIGVKQC
jgi:hypothetical protein